MIGSIELHFMPEDRPLLFGAPREAAFTWLMGGARAASVGGEICSDCCVPDWLAAPGGREWSGIVQYFYYSEF